MLRRRDEYFVLSVSAESSAQCAFALLAGLTSPFGALRSRSRHSRILDAGRRSCNRRRRKPRRCEVSLREAPVKENVSRGRTDVLNRALNAAANDIQGVNRVSVVDDTAGGGRTDRGDGSINFKILSAGRDREVHISGSGEKTQNLRASGSGQRNQRVSRGAIAARGR